MEPKKMSKEQALALAQIISKQFCITNHKEWVDFMQGSHPKVVHFLPYEEARKFVQELKLKSYLDWKEYCGKNDIKDIPSNPAKHYKNKWTSWGDFLEGKHKVPSKFLPFDEARDFVVSLALEDLNDWQTFCDTGERPKDIPHSPQKVYKGHGWIGWNYWLGIGLYRQEFYPEISKEDIFEEVQEDIMWDIDHIGGLIEAFREQHDTDEEILKEFRNEPTLFIEALKDYLEQYPREEGED